VKTKKKNFKRVSKDRHKGSPLLTAGKKKTRKPERNVIIDDFDLCVVKRTFTLKKKILPTCITILSTVSGNNFFLRATVFKKNTAQNWI